MLVVSNDFPPAVGGIAQVLSSVCRSLPPESVCVLAQKTDGDAAFDASQPYRVYRARYKPGRKAWAVLHLILFGLRTLLLAHRTGCGILLFDKAFPLGVTGLLARLFGLPFVVNTYGNDVLCRRSRLEDGLFRQVLHRATRVITISAFTREHLVRLGVKEERIVIMYPKIDLARFTAPVDTQQFEVQNGLRNKRIILSVGRLVERKGFDRVIAALPEIRKACPDVVYLVVGNGPDKERLDGLASECGVYDCVRFVTDCSHADLPQYYHVCDVFAMPSRYIEEQGDAEGFGIVFLEANACKKPVVAGRSGGQADAVIDGETGLLCDPNDTAEIATALMRLLDDSRLRERLGQQGFNRVKTSFREELYKQEFEQQILNIGA